MRRRHLGAARRLATVIAAMVLLLVASACSGTVDEQADTGTPTAAPATPRPTDEDTADGSGSDTVDGSGGDSANSDDASAAGPDPATPGLGDPDAAAEDPDDGSDRLVVLDANGQLATVKPDGSDVIALTDDDGTRNSQPTWSPDGSHIAWTNFDPTTGESHIVTDRFDRSDTLRKPVGSPPFYLHWDRSSSQIGWLAPSPGGIDFGLVETSPEGVAVRLDRGEPFWFSWGPLGDELIVHVSEFRLDRIDVEDGTVAVISENPGDFQAPVWAPDGNTLVYGNTVDGIDHLLTSGLGGEAARLLASYDGYLIFTLGPDGSRIAFQSVTRTPDPGIITASVDPGADGAAPRHPVPGAVPEVQRVRQELPTPDPDDPFADPIDEALINTLYVIGSFGGDALPISFEPALGFFWSPDGERLAFLTPGVEPNRLQWNFWDTTAPLSLTFGPEFIPTRTFAQAYLPFFDQYEQNVEFWSPEGDRFAWAGTDPTTGQTGIWTLDPATGFDVEFVIEGEFATWSPTAAASAASAM